MDDAGQVRIVAVFKPQPARAEDLRRRLMSLVAPTRREPGCIEYTLHEDTDDPGTFAFIETWASQADLDRHLATPAIRALVGSLAERLTEPLSVRTLRVLSP